MGESKRDNEIEVFDLDLSDEASRELHEALDRLPGKRRLRVTLRLSADVWDQRAVHDECEVRVLAVGLDKPDAEAAAVQAELAMEKAPDVEVWRGKKAIVGEALAGLAFDRVFYGPKLRRILEWNADALRPRLYPSAEGVL